MKVLILGGDGYLGWPSAMHLTSKGHDVAVVDNYLRRTLCKEEKTEPLYQVPNLNERARIWELKTGYSIQVFIGDLQSWDFVEKVFKKIMPEVIIHYAEQPSAPYSMLNRNAALLTMQNNLNVTANTIYAVREFVPDAHIIKIGTMGEYGTPNIAIEEGWIDIRHKGRNDKFLFPRQASSLYHTTKIMDTDLLWFYVRMWDLRVTDLMQGPVYGLHTDECYNEEKLCPFFNYDELFGTVLNRFVVQAAAEYPLTVFGKGEQIRGFIEIRDTLQCIRLSLENPPNKGELRIFNQFVETFSVNDLAGRVQSVGRKLDLNVRIRKMNNPRKEAENHYYNPVHTGLMELGLKPHYLTDEIIEKMIETALRYKSNINKDSIFKGVRWA